jgi:DNA-binding response OmpR family regulator
MPKKILIVDDEPDAVLMLTMRLEANGYAVISAADGEKGLEKARSEKPDLILLDVMMPKIDGYQVCRLLKFDKNFRHIPIIMITARTQDEDKKVARDTGADAYITKPYEAKELLATIKNLLKE